VSDADSNDELRDCFRESIPEIFEAAQLLDFAVSAHLRGEQNRADMLLRAADMPIIGEWLDSIWLSRSEYRLVRAVPNLPPVVPKPDRYKPRDATNEMKKSLVGRDGHHCRLCGIPLVRPEVRKLLTQHYPNAARWTGRRETEQHRGLQVMWLQYDHVVVHSRGGETTQDNLVVTCPACNYGRDRFMMSEVGLRDPRTYPRSPTWGGWRNWDGLERLLPEKERSLRFDVTQRSLPV
jgi:HNH endonuclease